MLTANASLGAASNLFRLRGFMGISQRQAVASCLRGEEAEYFANLLVELVSRIDAMPKTYEQDGVSDPIVTLHYFLGSWDWHITEKDIDADSAGQVQAFGLANDGHGGELGYISIADIIKHGAELDFHFEPRPLSQVRGA